MQQELPIRKIIHVDMDAFYASVEQRDNPELKGKALAVGGSSKRGVVAAASYEARKYGVRSAMSSVIAFRKCPHIIFVRPRFSVYREVSRQIREIFYQYTDLVEPLSLDEAYLDVSHNKKGIAKASLIAKHIKQEIKRETDLTASAGISINKFLAKIASDLHKPDGITLITPDQAVPFLAKLKIEKFHGIGKKTAEKMRKMGIRNGADLVARGELELVRRFGKMGRFYFNIAKGIDDREVKPNRKAKSIGAENTFSADLEEEDEMLKALQPLIEKVSKRLQEKDAKARTITLKIKYHDFELKTRSKTIDRYIDTVKEIHELISFLLLNPEFPVRPVRLLGVYASNLFKEGEDLGPRQLTLEF